MRSHSSRLAFAGRSIVTLAFATALTDGDRSVTADEAAMSNIAEHCEEIR